MKIAIIGVGAVGGVVAWHLTRAGLAPTIVARPAQAAALAREGLTLVGAGVQETLRVAVIADAAALGAQDIVLIALKAQDLKGALHSIMPLLGRDTMLVPLLNGIPWWYFQGVRGAHDGRIIAAVDPDGALSAALRPGHIVGAVVYIASSRETPTRTRWNGRKRLILGEPTGFTSERLTRLVDALQRGDLAAEATADIRREIWMKLLGNATYNPLSVVTGATIGHMASDPPLRRIIKLIMEEAIAVAQALGALGEVDTDERLKVSPPMRDFRTSMLQDFDAGRPLELSGLVDAVVELGCLSGVPTPTLETIGALAAERWSAVHGLSARTPLPGA